MAERRLTLSIDGAPYEPFQLEGRFAISDLFRLAVRGRLIADVAPKDLIGKPFVLELTPPSGEKVTVHGVVAAAAFERLERADNVFDVHLAPEVGALDFGQNSLVFQDQAVPDVIGKVLESAGIASSGFELRLSGSYPSCPYIAQYRESDWAFIARLCAQEGIVYWFELDDAATKVVFADDSTSAADLPGGASISSRDAGALLAGAEHVDHLQHAHTLTSDATRIVDYNPKTPAVKLNSSSKVDKGALEACDFPGEFDVKARGDALAKVRLDALRAGRERLLGETNGSRMRVGRKLEVTDHVVTTLNAPWFCTQVEWDLDDRRHSTDSASFRARFAAVPIKTPFRTAHRPPVHAGGPQTAVVSGPPGKEIHSDDTGRVRAQFHWDRIGKKDDKASTFMRVGQVPLGGSMVMPRVTWEVLVTHQEGDADHPFVDAHLYEAEHPVPYALPANKTRTSWQTATTPGGGSVNEMRFEDKAGAEEIFINSSKDTKIVTGNDKAVSVKNNHTYQIGANEDIDIGSNHALQVDADQTVSIGASETLTVSAKRTLIVKGSLSNTIGASRTATIVGGLKMSVDGGRTATIGASMTSVSAAGVSRMAMGSLTATIGAASIALAGKDVSDTVVGAASETVGAARIVMSGGDMSMGVKGAVAETVGGACLYLAGAKFTEDVTSALAVTVGGAFIANGPKITIEASGEISLLCGGSSIKITSSSIEIKAPTLASPSAIFHKSGGTIHHNP